MKNLIIMLFMIHWQIKYLHCVLFFEKILKAIVGRGRANCEIIFHPGYPGDEYLKTIDSLTDERKHDLDILLGAPFFDLLNKYNFSFDYP